MIAIKEQKFFDYVLGSWVKFEALQDGGGCLTIGQRDWHFSADGELVGTGVAMWDPEPPPSNYRPKAEASA